jgi:4'-phosphopantetheinyl transferase
VEDQLRRSELHIWTASLVQPKNFLARMRSVLSDDEIKRASRFHRAAHRNVFVVRRGVLRLILSQYLNTSPEKLLFSYSPTGKPYLAAESGSSTLSFSVSHSYQVAAYVIARNIKVGIDIEFMGLLSSRLDIVPSSLLLGDEKRLFQHLPEESRREAFYHFWVQKEAVLKASGLGISKLADAKILSTVWDSRCNTFEVKNEDESTASCWCSRRINVHPHYAGALAVDSRNKHYLESVPKA